MTLWLWSQGGSVTLWLWSMAALWLWSMAALFQWTRDLAGRCPGTQKTVIHSSVIYYLLVILTIGSVVSNPSDGETTAVRRIP